MYGSLEDFPLRQINFVKTRTSVLKAVTHLLKEKSFDEITVDEVCQITQISRGTFFNYFPTKDYVFYYYLRIFTIKITQRIRHWEKDMSFRKQLEQIYIWFDEESQYPEFIGSYLRYLIDNGDTKNDVKLTEPEFVYFFTDINNTKEYAYYNNLTIPDIIRTLCKEAQDKGELSQNINLEIEAHMLLSFLLASFITYRMVKDKGTSIELFHVMLERVLPA